MSVQAISWAIAQHTGSGTRKAVLVALANRHNNDTGKCCPKIDRLAKEAEFSERAVRAALTKLAEDGFISRDQSRREDGTKGVYQYVLHLERGSKPPAGGAAGPPAGGAAQEPEVNLEPLNPSTVEAETASTVADPVPTAATNSLAQKPALVETPQALAETSAQTLVAEFIDAAAEVGVPMPRRVVGQLAKTIKGLLDEGQVPDAIRAGLTQMVSRRLVQPSLLPNFVVEAALPSRAPPHALRYGRGMTTQQIIEQTRGLE